MKVTTEHDCGCVDEAVTTRIVTCREHGQKAPVETLEKPFTIKTAAPYLGISEVLVAEECRIFHASDGTRGLRNVRKGRRIIIPRSAVMEWQNQPATGQTGSLPRRHLLKVAK